MLGFSLIFTQLFWSFNTFSLASNESEAEEDEVDKPTRKKRKGRKKALQKNIVGFFLIRTMTLTTECV